MFVHPALETWTWMAKSCPLHPEVVNAAVLGWRDFQKERKMVNLENTCGRYGIVTYTILGTLFVFFEVGICSPMDLES
jgi:hypothetical protein